VPLDYVQLLLLLYYILYPLLIRLQFISSYIVGHINGVKVWWIVIYMGLQCCKDSEVLLSLPSLNFRSRVYHNFVLCMLGCIIYSLRGRIDR